MALLSQIYTFIFEGTSIGYPTRHLKSTSRVGKKIGQEVDKIYAIVGS